MDFTRRDIVETHTVIFQRMLAHMQGKIEEHVPDDEYELIKTAFVESAFEGDYDASCKMMRNLLRELCMTKHYENIPQLIRRLGYSPDSFLDLPADVEAELVTMYSQARAAHRHQKPMMREISASFIAQKLLQLLGKEEYIHHFGMIKSQDIRRRLDEIWRSICQETGWQFIP